MTSTPLPPGGQPPGGFVPLTRKPDSAFIVGNVPAPTLAYVPPDGFFRVNIQNSFPGAQVVVTIRTMRSFDGVVTLSQDTYTPPSSGATDTHFIQGVEGFILSATATSNNLALRRGQCFVSVQMCGGSQTDVHVQQTLCQDYIQQGYSIAFPGGTIRQSTEGPGRVYMIGPTSAPGGNPFIVVVPNTKRWRLMALWGQLFTGATAGVRNPQFVADDGIGDPFFESTVTQNLGPSSSTNISAASGMGRGSLDAGQVVLPIPDNLILVPGQRFLLSAVGLLGTDQISSVSYQVEEWLEQ